MWNINKEMLMLARSKDYKTARTVPSQIGFSMTHTYEITNKKEQKLNGSFDWA